MYVYLAFIYFTARFLYTAACRGQQLFQIAGVTGIAAVSRSSPAGIPPCAAAAFFAAAATLCSGAFSAAFRYQIPLHPGDSFHSFLSAFTGTFRLRSSP